MEHEVYLYNKKNLTKLLRSIVFAQNNFALVVVRCNYQNLSHQIRVWINENCDFDLQDIVLSSEISSLYDAIDQAVNHQSSCGASISGFENIVSLDDLLRSVNIGRDSFRDRFSFPIILWLNDENLNKLSSFAPDFSSWTGIPIHFTFPPEFLVQRLENESEDVFEKVTEVGAGRFPRSSAFYHELDAPLQSELKIAYTELKQKNIRLSVFIEASLNFIWGLEAYVNNLIDEAGECYSKSLNLWAEEFEIKGISIHYLKRNYNDKIGQSDSKSNLQKLSCDSDDIQTSDTILQPSSHITTSVERVSCVLFYMGLKWSRHAVLNRSEYRQAKQRSHSCYKACIELLQQYNRLGLVAKFINAWAETLYALQEWDQLEIVAERSIQLHQQSFDPIRLAYSHGLLAEVALARSEAEELGGGQKQALWRQAEEYAREALEFNKQQPRNKELQWAQRHYSSLYNLLLARSLLAQAQCSVTQKQSTLLTQQGYDCLVKSEETCTIDYDPLLYTHILAALQSYLFNQGHYLQAFYTKQRQHSIEQQYGFRAFIGASRLQPEREVLSPALIPIEFHDSLSNNLKDNFQVQRLASTTMDASGRQQDVQNLITRLSGNHHRLIVIHGPSGVGKSSLVNAGLVPALKKHLINGHDILPVIVSIYTESVGELAQNFFSALADRGIVIEYPKSFKDKEDAAIFLKQELRTNSEDRNLLTVLIFDQLEEFFFEYPEPESRQFFWSFMESCFNLSDVKVVFSLREDYLYYLLEGERLGLGNITDDLLGCNQRYPLDNFSKSEAQQTIQNLTQRSQFHLEDDLIDQLVLDLAEDLGKVRPIELQVVGAQLQDDKIVSLNQYQSLGAYPKQILVERFLKQVIQDCGPENRKITNLILFILTDEQENRPIKTESELLTELSVIQGNISIPVENFRLSLEILVSSGFVLLLSAPLSKRYQLVHDYLVPFIRQKQESGLIGKIKELQKIKEESQAEIEQLRKENELLEALNREQRLKKRLQQVQKQRRVVTRIASVATILGVTATGLAGLAYLQSQELNAAKIDAITAEIEANNTLSSSLLRSEQQIEALSVAIKGAQQLKDISVGPSIEFPTAIQLLNTLYDIQEYNRLDGHIDWVNAVRFSPDGEMIASASSDKTIKLWNKNGALIRTLEHTGRVNSLAFSPNSQILISGSDDKTIMLWELDKEKPAQIIEGHLRSVNSLSFSPKGSLFASGSDDETIKIWNVRGELVRTLEGHASRVKAVSFSPDGKTIASASWDKSVKLWNRKGQLIKTLTHDARVTTVSFTNQGDLITGDWEGAIKLWDKDGIFLHPLIGHVNRITSLSISSDGKVVVTVSADNVIKFWSLDREDSSLQALTPFSSLTLPSIESVRFSPSSQDKRLAFAGGGDNAIRLWQLDGLTPKTLPDHESLIVDVELSPNGQKIAAATSYSILSEDEIKNGEIIIWTTEGKKDLVLPADGTIAQIEFSPEGNYLAVANNPLLKAAINTGKGSGNITLWTLSGKALKTFDVPGTVSSINFSANQKLIAAAYTLQDPVQESYVIIWDVLTEKEIMRFPAHDDRITTIQFSPNGDMIVSASWDNTAKIWDLMGRKLAVLGGEDGHGGPVTDISFTPDQSTIASSSYDKTIKLWKSNGKLLTTLKEHTGAVNEIRFHNNGDGLIAASADQTLTLWDINLNYREKAKLLGKLERNGAINSISINTESDLVVSAIAHRIELLDFNLESLLGLGCTWLQDYLETNASVQASAQKEVCKEY